MKKIKYLVGIITCFLFGMSVAVAADFSTSLSSSANPIVSNQEFTVTMKVSGVSNFCGTMGTFTYDANKLTIVSNSGAGGFAATLGSKLVLDAANGINGSANIATIKFKPKAAFAIGESTTISLGNQEGSTCSGDIKSGSGSSVKINMSAPKSTNNFLKSLSVSEGKIDFGKTKTAYSITVDNNVDKITINGEVEDTKAKLAGTGTKTLKVYKNAFSVVVTSESGAKKTYTINVIRKDEDGNTSDPSKTASKPKETDKTLKALEIEGFPIDFNSGTKNYTINIGHDVNDLDISALSTSNEVEVKINKPESLVEGENTITIVVTDAEGAETIYTIKVNKEKAPTEDLENDIVVDKVNIYKIISFIMVPIALIEAGIIIVLLKKKRNAIEILR